MGYNGNGLRDKKTYVKEPKREELARLTKNQVEKKGGQNFSPMNEQTGDNARYLKIIMQFNALPAVDLFKADDVQKQIGEYFRICFENDFKPLVSSLASVLGLSRHELLAIVKEDFDKPFTNRWKALPTFTISTIKKAYLSMEQLWESYMQNGKINPVSGIFLAKNNYGYQDKVEHVVEGKVVQSDEQVEARYIEMKDDEL